MSSQAVYAVERFGVNVPLYAGPIRLADGESEREYDALLTFEWLPTPSVRYEAWSSNVHDGIALLVEGGVMDGGLSVVSTSSVPSPPSVLPTKPAEARVAFSGSANRIVVGDPAAALDRVTVHLVNFKAFRSILVLEAEGWRVAIEPVRDLDEVTRSLQERGGFGFTHTAVISRLDNSAFSFEAFDEIREALFIFLSFIRGALVGQALPVGIGRDGTPACAEWGVTLVDRWRGLLSWSSRERPDAVTSVFPLFMARWQDDLWRKVLKRAVRYYVEANEPSLDKALVMAQAALEMLSWAVLYVGDRWLRPDEGKLRASSRLRLLLKWAGVPTEIPDSLKALRRSASDLKSADGPADGPRLFTEIRNEIIHPTKNRLSRDHDELVDAWRLSLWYIELVLLRVLGYEGQYASRLLERRWEGDVEPVPWA